MNTLLVIVIAVAAFVAGVLVGRANPKKADKLAAMAEDLKNKAQDQFQGK
jgi:outer membrane murein-binding lipoprotein Lpp